MKINKRWRKVLSIIGILLATMFVVYFSFRNQLLNWGIRVAANKIEDRTDATLKIGTASFTGLSTIGMNAIHLIPANGDTLFRADTLSTRISLWMLFTATLRIKAIAASGVLVSFSCNDSLCNYSGFLRSGDGKAKKTEKNYSVLLRRLFDRLFNLAPQQARLENISFSYRKNDVHEKLHIREFFSDNKSFTGIIEDARHGGTWQCEGIFSQTRHSWSMNLYPQTERRTLPMIKEIYGVSASFDTLHVALDKYNWSGNVFTAHAGFSVTAASIFNPKLSDDTIKIPYASIDLKFKSGKNYLQVDSSSLASLASFHFHPFIRFVSDTSKSLTLNISGSPVAANDFFSSLPQGIFDEVRDFRADGKLHFRLNFGFNSAFPEAATFKVDLKKEKFRLRKLGTVDLLKLNREFIQNVYESGRLIKSFPVGPSNPHFTPLGSISPYFINAVLTSEDGNFYFHNGFNEDAFRKSIVANYKAGKFVRGGSTISMQLVKNVFLTRKKTIARKAEEALLVWLIESNRLSSKERMLEVYLNIIELGPNVYGIGEASAFYFDKKPSEISLPEGIFLASLLPRPKGFKYNFDSLGHLKPYFADYYSIVSDFMLRKNLITQEEHDQLLPQIELLGPAKQIVLFSDSIRSMENKEKNIMQLH